MAANGTINKILKHSFVDGPGNRAVLFLQGCTFHCLYCHNPYTINFCTHCGICVALCLHEALSLEDGQVVWQTGRCEECDTCIATCPYNSSPRTRSMTARQVWEDEIAPVRNFISGITVSGGEPTVQLDFVTELFTLIKGSSDLTTLIETNGCLQPERLEALRPVLDYAMVDLKAWDPDLHFRLTGQDGDFVRQTIRLLHSWGKLYAVRQVIVPGYTDAEDNMTATARFLEEIDPLIPLRLLRFRPHGTVGEAQTWPAPGDDLLDRLVDVAIGQGLRDVSRSM